MAVSGGRDSLALAILADRWARERGGRIHALTVDHGLRPESAEEARRVRGWLAARRIGHEILPWSGEKPTTGIEAAARAARYRLLAGWCRERCCLHLLTAHHREDQVETHLLRRRAGSGPDGLAGMSAVRELADCRLLRPLLGVAGARLAAFLAAEGQHFITDPSNRDPAFERARLRILGVAAAAGVRPAELRARIAALAGARQVGEIARNALLARAVIPHPAGFALVEPRLLLSAPPEIADRALAALTTAIGGAAYPPRTRRIVRLRMALACAEPGCDPPGRTLGGCRFVAWRGHVLVLREAAAAAGPVELRPGAELVWDRRFRVSLAADARQNVRVGYLGQGGGSAALDGRPLDPRPLGVPRFVRRLLPAVWDATGLAAVPDLGYRRDGAGVMPRIVLRPVNCLAGGSFAVVSPAADLMCS